jgi:DNA-directed RNA polymerase specialized sigma24 family protein
MQLDGRSDDDLLGLAARGHGEAFALLYLRHRRTVLGFVGCIVGDGPRARAALVETFRRVLQGVTALRRGARFAPLLYRAARHAALDLAEREPAAVAADHELDPLPVPQREAVYLRLACGLDAEGIAAVCGCPAEEARHRVRQGLDRLLSRAPAPHLRIVPDVDSAA